MLLRISWIVELIFKELFFLDNFDAHFNYVIEFLWVYSVKYGFFNHFYFKRYILDEGLGDELSEVVIYWLLAKNWVLFLLWVFNFYNF